MTTTAINPPLEFWRSIAANVARDNGPNAGNAKRLLRLLRLHRHLTREADGPDAALAEGLAVNLLPAIEAAAARLRLGEREG